ncbi:hypothetical protein QBC35DRAFT_534290 [Podospora australis]|uniref:Uncharacterized protein n=1 Tax=Podospora australis TaxID=1536484 RepID=A0AAN6WRZ3_9PEZI|nr:hypothetical protein QBC35DRAFT_534290 [Podospora australis]
MMALQPPGRVMFPTRNRRARASFDEEEASSESIVRTLPTQDHEPVFTFEVNKFWLRRMLEVFAGSGLPQSEVKKDFGVPTNDVLPNNNRNRNRAPRTTPTKPPGGARKRPRGFADAAVSLPSCVDEYDSGRESEEVSVGDWIMPTPDNGSFGKINQSMRWTKAEQRHHQRLRANRKALTPLLLDDQSNVLDGDSDDLYERDLPKYVPRMIKRSQNRAHDVGCVLLCWGREADCRVVAVPHIPRSTDHELFWKEIRKGWSNALVRRSWGPPRLSRWLLGWKLPWWGVKAVKLVKIRILGRLDNIVVLRQQAGGIDHQGEEGAIMCGVWKDWDLSQDQAMLKQSYADEKRTGFWWCRDKEPDYDAGDWEWELYPCCYSSQDDRIVHNATDSSGCRKHLHDGDRGCDVENSFRQDLDQLEMELFRTQLFHRPDLAVHHDLGNERLVHSTAYILRPYKNWDCPSLGMPSFFGLRIKEGWLIDADAISVILPLVVLGLVVIVVSAWLVYGDWAVAWNVAACLVPVSIAMGSLVMRARD